MAAICAYISAVWAGTADPFWLHLLLVPGSALAGISVGAGILLERPKFSAKVHRVAFWLVIVGVSFETLFTIALFVVDERISGAQQDKIIDLETRLASRQLNDAQIAAISEKLKQFAGQKFSGMVAVGNPEAHDLWVTIDKTLNAANWIRAPSPNGSIGDPPAVMTATPDEGVRIFVPVEDAAELRASSLALESALTNTGIAAIAVTDPSAQRRPKIIVIEVGPKPR